MKLSIQGDRVEVQIGSAQASAPLDELEALIHILRGALKGAKLMPRRPAASQAAPPAKAPAATGAPRAKKAPGARAPAAKKASAPKGAAKSRANKASAGSGGTRKPGTPVRKSRKRVGDALVDWMRENPGWHSTETLLQTVIDNKMTDANPKLAVTIALGKQKGKLFDSDDKGHWKLAGVEAGPPPRVRSKRKTKRKKKRPSKAKATPAGPAAHKADQPAAKAPAKPAAEGTAMAPAGPAGHKEDQPAAKAARPERWNAAAPGKTKRALSSLLGLGVMADDE